MVTIPKTVVEMLGTAIAEINGASVLLVPPGVGKSCAAHGLTAMAGMLGQT